MAHTEHDHLVNEVPHFLNVPTDWLDDFGRIALLAGRIELVGYQIAESLGLPRPKNGRTRPFRTECESIAARLEDPWMPVDVAERLNHAWCAGVSAWVETHPE